MTHNEISDIMKLPLDRVKAILALAKSDVKTLEYLVVCKTNPVSAYKNYIPIEDFDFETEPIYPGELTMI